MGREQFFFPKKKNRSGLPGRRRRARGCNGQQRWPNLHFIFFRPRRLLSNVALPRWIARRGGKHINNNNKRYWWNYDFFRVRWRRNERGVGNEQNLLSEKKWPSGIRFQHFWPQRRVLRWRPFTIFSCCLGLRNLETNVLTFSPRNNLPDIRNLSRQQTKRVKFFENIPRVWRGIIVLVQMTQPETRLMVFFFFEIIFPPKKATRWTSCVRYRHIHAVHTRSHTHTRDTRNIGTEAAQAEKLSEKLFSISGRTGLCWARPTKAVGNGWSMEKSGRKVGLHPPPKKNG